MDGFAPTPGDSKKYAILPFSVGIDPGLATKTRRGWCATLDDWFDPGRVNDDYVPNGFKPFDADTYPVKGHFFGLDLTREDRKALIAFLKTL